MMQIEMNEQQRIDTDHQNNTIEMNVKRCSMHYFWDGRRRVDYVLVYNEDEVENNNDERKNSRSRDIVTAQLESLITFDDVTKQRDRRRAFENRLLQRGLHIEIRRSTFDESTRFVLIHAPYNLLARQAEAMQLKKPIRLNDLIDRRESAIAKRSNFIIRTLRRCCNVFDLDDSVTYRIRDPDYFSAPFTVARQHIYLGNENKDTFFTDAERIMLVYDVLIRTRYDTITLPMVDGAKYHVGIERLIHHGTYLTAYALHAGDFMKTKDVVDLVTCSDRELLYQVWARFRRFYKHQPLPLIREYFGSKVALYFGWIGYYTRALLPAAIIGVCVVIYGAATRFTDIPSNDVCQGTDIMMCPNCEILCDFWRLSDSCSFSKLTYIFDNLATVLFAAFMSIWATLFLEGCKRRLAELSSEWGMLDFESDEDTIRPEFELSVHTRRLNPITGDVEPYLPLSERLIRLCGSAVTVLFFLLLVLAFVAGIIIYYIIAVNVLYQTDNVSAYAVILASISSAVLNLIAIRIMSTIYFCVAYRLTDWERPRTQSDFDNSYTFKVFLFQFINYYSSVVYLAFIKGRVSGVPFQERDYRPRIFGYELEACDPAGCMVELVILLAVIMVGNQLIDGIIEIVVPVIMNRIRSCIYRISHRLKTKRGAASAAVPTAVQSSAEADNCLGPNATTNNSVPYWERDYLLNAANNQLYIDEYLESVLQFGFVTLFVAAFPLAPLFALINNIIEIRVDAYKIVVAQRRPIPSRAKDIGIWLPILDGISNLAVLTNACVIAFSSEFVPKLLYTMTSSDGTLHGYINETLSHYFNASNIAPYRSNYPKVTECRFRGYRTMACNDNVNSTLTSTCDDVDYVFSAQWWQVLAVKLAFIIIFEHVVFLIKHIFSITIPDVSSRVARKLRRERYLARKARLNEEIGECSIALHNYSDGTDANDGNTPSFTSRSSQLKMAFLTSPPSQLKID